MIMKVLIILLLIIVSILTFSQQENNMQKEVQKFFKSKYKDPVIENQSKDVDKVFPKLTFYSVFERKYLVADPLIPHIWVVTSKKGFYRNYEFEKALEEEKIAPLDDNEAFNYARALVSTKYNVYYHVNDEKAFSGVIPEKYFQEKFYPVIEKQNNCYTVTIYFYYTNSRYANLNSLYRNNLVEYLVTIEGFRYTVKVGRVYYDEEDKDEILLKQAIVGHICDKNLFNDLNTYHEKRLLYGITDPPVKEIIEQRNAELTNLWDKGFAEHQNQIYYLLRKVLDKNPEFMFDINDIYETTKDCPSVKGIENYENTLGHTLQDIISRFVEYENGKK
jgi:hypothetical protein